MHIYLTAKTDYLQEHGLLCIAVRNYHVLYFCLWSMLLG